MFTLLRHCVAAVGIVHDALSVVVVATFRLLFCRVNKQTNKQTNRVQKKLKTNAET